MHKCHYCLHNKFDTLIASKHRHTPEFYATVVKHNFTKFLYKKAAAVTILQQTLHCHTPLV